MIFKKRRVVHFAEYKLIFERYELDPFLRGGGMYAMCYNCIYHDCYKVQPRCIKFNNQSRKYKYLPIYKLHHGIRKRK